MGWNPKTFAAISAGALLLIVAMAFVNHKANADQKNVFVIATVLLLFLVFVYSLIPPFIALFVHLQTQIGNGDLAPIRWLRGHQMGVAIGFWSIFTLGLLIALPVMLHDMMGIEIRMPIGKSQGTLVANLGMTIEEVRSRSSLKLVDGFQEGLTGTTKLIGDVVFDFEIAGTGTRFERCRYYWIDTGRKGDLHIHNMNIGISTQKMLRADLDAADRSLQERLERDGWKSGQFYWRGEDEQRLHSGKTSSGRGWYWLKGETILHLEHKRMDDEKPGEDAATAGEWIQYIDLWPKSDSINKGLEFEK